jgi:hypothetical protein
MAGSGEGETGAGRSEGQLVRFNLHPRCVLSPDQHTGQTAGLPAQRLSHRGATTYT